MSTKRAWDLLPQQERITIQKALIAHFELERDEKIGVIAADEIIDLVLQEATTPIFNSALEHCKHFIEQKFTDTTIELDSLRKG